MKRPRPIERSAWVVAALEPGEPRYLRRADKGGHWVVTMEPERALGFDDRAAAEAALANYEGLGHGRHIHGAPGGWQVWRMATRITLLPD